MLLEVGRPVELTLIEHEDWKKLRKIGQGSFGTVFVAVNNRTGALFAIKEMWLGRHNNDDARAESLQAICKEVVLLSNFEHKNIVKYLGSALIDDNFYMFLEYVAGGSLADLLLHLAKPLSLRLAKNYTAQCLEGLEYLHSNGVIHRDLKPGNVLLTVDGVLKLADFGGSFDTTNLTHTQSQSLKGTPAFMAPEIIKSSYGPREFSKSRHTTKSDIWSLGIMTYNLITNDYPYKVHNIYELFVNLSLNKIQIEWPDNMNAEFRGLIASCLKMCPKERPTASAVLTSINLIDVSGEESDLEVCGEGQVAHYLSTSSVDLTVSTLGTSYLTWNTEPHPSTVTTEYTV